MVVVPAPLIVTTPAEETVATEVLSEEKVKELEEAPGVTLKKQHRLFDLRLLRQGGERGGDQFSHGINPLAGVGRQVLRINILLPSPFYRTGATRRTAGEHIAAL